MGIVDTAILFAYLAAMVAIGMYAQRRQRDVDDYYLGGRRMGPWTIACLWMGAWIGGAAVVGSSTRAFEYGVTGGWYVIAQLIGCLLFGLLVAERIKRIGDSARHYTYPDFIEASYDGRTRIVSTLTTVLAFTAYSAGQLVASAVILQVLLGWDYDACLLLAGAIVIVYTATGGYLAVTYTDWVQVALLLFGVVAIGIPVAIWKAGSWASLQAALPASYFDPGAQGWDRIAALTVSIALSFFVGMDSFSRCFAARSPRAARQGTLLALVLIAPLAVASVWIGLACAVLYPGASGEGIVTRFVIEAFPVGLKGLMVVGILSAIMSTADICILTASANYARDIHQRFLQPGISPRALLRISVYASFVAGLLAMAMAWRMRDIIDILQLGFTINSAALFLPTVAAVYGFRLGASAAFWSISLALATVVGWRLAAAMGAGGLFAIDPLWPGLSVSALVLLGFMAAGRHREPA